MISPPMRGIRPPGLRTRALRSLRGRWCHGLRLWHTAPDIRSDSLADEPDTALGLVHIRSLFKKVDVNVILLDQAVILYIEACKRLHQHAKAWSSGASYCEPREDSHRGRNYGDDEDDDLTWGHSQARSVHSQGWTRDGKPRTRSPGNRPTDPALTLV